MDEAERTMRMLAQLLLRELPSVVVDSGFVRASLEAALARPDGTAARDLRLALGHPPAVRAWVAAQQVRGSVRDRLLTAAVEDRIPARFLTVEAPETASPEADLPCEVLVTQRAWDRSARCQPFAVPPGGVRLRLVAAPGRGLSVLEGWPATMEVYVPEDGDSERALFVFRTGIPGLRTIKIRAYLGGRPVGELALDVMVGAGRTAGPPRPVSATIATFGAADEGAGNLTLQLDEAGQGYICRLCHGDGVLCDTVLRFPNEVVDEVRRHLRKAAAGRHDADPGLARSDLRNLSLELWERVLPKSVRDRLTDVIGRARTLSVVTDSYHGIPWEILLPAPSGQADTPFLSEVVPILRQVSGQEYASMVRISDAGYALPPDSPTGTHHEIESVQSVIGPGVRHRRPPFVRRRDLLPYVEQGQFDLFHLACHNSSPKQRWPEVRMADSPMSPVHLNQAVAARALSGRRPLVFFNACDSVGCPSGVDLTGWADRFLRAGAGAFIGTTWAVRSTSAADFAVSLFESLGTEPNLGLASVRARQASGDPADPTRLAYAVYADVNTKVHRD